MTPRSTARPSSRTSSRAGVRPGDRLPVRPSVVPLEAAHVAAAAALVVAGTTRLRAQVPVLPEAWTDVHTVGRLVRALVERGNGMALVDEAGTLAGFQAATLLDGHGGRWAYTPDVGHATLAAVTDDAGAFDVERAVERLYAALAERWVAEACTEHVVTILADDAAALDAYGRLGFALHVIDLVRDLSPVAGAALPAGGEVRRALPADAGAVSELHAGLVRHLRAAPVFLRIPNAPPPEIQRSRIADPAGAVFVATVDDRPVAFLRIGPSAADVATVVRDRGTASISNAFTVPELRGSGIGSALLAEAVAWARDGGYVRIGVDHETANGEAARFWARHATPVAVSLARRLAPRTVPGVG